MINIPISIKKKLPFLAKFAIKEISDIRPKLIEKLSKNEIEELSSFSNIKRQREFLTSRLLLKDLAKEIGIPKLNILKDELGQPHGLAGEQKYFVSIAHTSKLVFCGIAEKAIGVDLEPLDREVYPKLKQRILHPAEEQLFSEVMPIRIWTIKEAYIKLRGQGLRMNMNEVQIQKRGSDFFVQLNNDKSAKICSFQAKENWVAIAYYQ